MGMSTRSRRFTFIDLIGRIAFPGDERAVRRKNAKSLLLSIFLGLIACAAFGCALFLLNKQGRL